MKESKDSECKNWLNLSRDHTKHYLRVAHCSRPIHVASQELRGSSVCPERILSHEDASFLTLQVNGGSAGWDRRAATQHWQAELFSCLSSMCKCIWWPGVFKETIFLLKHSLSLWFSFILLFSFQLPILTVYLKGYTSPFWLRGVVEFFKLYLLIS